MSFFNDLSPVGKILCGAALVVAAPVAAAAAIPVCAAIGTVGIGLGASSSAVVSAGITAVGAVETAATTITRGRLFSYTNKIKKKEQKTRHSGRCVPPNDVFFIGE